MSEEVEFVDERALRLTEEINPGDYAEHAYNRNSVITQLPCLFQPECLNRFKRILH
jgi:hypothetical protein